MILGKVLSQHSGGGGWEYTNSPLQSGPLQYLVFRGLNAFFYVLLGCPRKLVNG